MNTASIGLPARTRGFSLIELAIVLLVVGVLLGTTVLTLSGQIEARDFAESRKQLDQARDAVYGFAVRNGRLPCPAPANGGLERFCVEPGGRTGGCTVTLTPQTHGRCSNPDGFLPAVTLGIGPVDAGGAIRDPWGSQVRYVVADTSTPANAWVYTRPNGMKDTILGTPFVPNLRVCTTSAGSSATDCDPASPGSAAIAVLFSRGKNRSVGGVGADEQENADGPADVVFVAKDTMAVGTPAEFDDTVIWISPNILYNRLVSAGTL